MCFVMGPALSLRHIGPCADICQPFGERVDIAVCAINAGELTVHILVWHAAMLVQVLKDFHQETCMLSARNPSKVRDLAHIPQQAHSLGICGPRHHFGIVGHRFQRRKIITFAHPAEPRVVCPILQRLDQAFDVSELQPVVAPH